MPSVSKAQRRLMGAAEHGADFPMAQKLRQTMTHEQLHDFASTKEKGLPTHVKPAAPRPVPAAPARLGSLSMPAVAPKPVKTGGAHPIKNLGDFAHPKKGK